MGNGAHATELERGDVSRFVDENLIAEEASLPGQRRAGKELGAGLGRQESIDGRSSEHHGAKEKVHFKGKDVRAVDGAGAKPLCLELA